jgi:putative membrane protein
MPFDVSDLPAVNACLNGLSAALLLCGFAAVKSGRRSLHARFMVSTFVVSILFLTSYVTYHVVLDHPATRYGGAGALRAIYLIMLTTHMVLAAVVPPMAVGAIWLAASGRIDRHRRLVHWLFPAWLYVSVTGVLIYLMLRPYYL